jgi:hypothetical protein
LSAAGTIEVASAAETSSGTSGGRRHLHAVRGGEHRRLAVEAALVRQQPAAVWVTAVAVVSAAVSGPSERLLRLITDGSAAAASHGGIRPGEQWWRRWADSMG